MRAVDDALAVGDFIFAVDKDGALAAQLIHNEAVMNNFLADVDWRAEGFEGDANNIDRPDYAGAEAARFQ